jgi:ribonuclease T2
MNSRLPIILMLAILFAGAAWLWLAPSDQAPVSPPPAPTATTIEARAPAAPPQKPKSDSKSVTSEQFLILAVSWQPAFCESAPNRVECRQQDKDRYDATNFALHGLWPRDEYCDVTSRIERLDRDGRWSVLPPVDLAPALRRTLDRLMPGARSDLDRHQWIKHGTCFGADQTAYFAASTQLLAALNASAVRDLFADNVGKRLTQKQIRAAFDDAFGAGAGQRVRVACSDDGNRQLISELTIGLNGRITDPADLRRLIMAARPTSGGCAGGIVDPVGLQ